MLPDSQQRIRADLPDDALVLDVGGWAKPFDRADWVIDLMPYETRGLYGYEGDRAAERFSADTWAIHDLCAHEPWPFADDQFDFATCAHTLEDVRDPVRLCSELVRVAKAGYVEVPSRLEEQTRGVQFDDLAGWGHHHWLCDVDAGAPSISFVFKHHIVHQAPYHLPPAFVSRLTPERRVSRFWWRGSFAFAERIFFEPADIDRYLRALVEEHADEVPAPRVSRWRGTSRRTRD